MQILKTPSEFKICIRHKERMLHLWTNISVEHPDHCFIKIFLDVERHKNQIYEVDFTLLRMMFESAMKLNGDKGREERMTHSI